MRIIVRHQQGLSRLEGAQPTALMRGERTLVNLTPDRY